MALSASIYSDVAAAILAKAKTLCPTAVMQWAPAVDYKSALAETVWVSPAVEKPFLISYSTRSMSQADLAFDVTRIKHVSAGADLAPEVQALIALAQAYEYGSFGGALVTNIEFVHVAEPEWLRASALYIGGFTLHLKAIG